MEYARDKFYLCINGHYHIWLHCSIHGAWGKDHGRNFLTRTTFNGRGWTNCWSRLVSQAIENHDSTGEKGVDCHMAYLLYLLFKGYWYYHDGLSSGSRYTPGAHLHPYGKQP